MPQNIQLEGGSYEIIKGRLDTSRNELEEKLNQLNEARKKVFGGIEQELIGTERIHSPNNCIAQDIVALGEVCVFGFNVHIGLRSKTTIEDVFAVYNYKEGAFEESDVNVIGDEQFRTDVENLYKYYRESTFYRFWEKGGYLYMIFKVSEKEGDIKAFKWLVKPDNTLQYIDNRSEHEYRFPSQYDFKWVKATRDNFVSGAHPHVSIQDRVFVETVGGDLTIKVEDNTNDGKGIYNEPVVDKDQKLDDGEYHYADLGDIIALKIKPYQEAPRYYLYNEKLQEAVKVEAMEDSAQLLPDGQGIIFANGYYLQTGEYKVFDLDRTNKKFERKVASPNGEDHLYIYYRPNEGRYILMSYNIIAQQVETPIVCNGYSIYGDGSLINFRRDAEPTKHHQLQIWRTPFSKEIDTNSEFKDHLLYKVGNKDIVSCMSECSSLIALLKKDEPYADVYRDIVKNCSVLLDSYYWIDKKEAFGLDQAVQAIKASSNTAIDEFEKVRNIRKATTEATATVKQEAETLFKDIDTISLDDITTFVDTLTELRKVRGSILGLKDLRYVDNGLIESLDTTAAERGADLEQECVRFLLRKEALGSYEKRIGEIEKSVQSVKTSVQADELDATAAQVGKDLELLIDIVSGLKIEDPTETTRIIESISALYSVLNGTRSSIRNARKEIRSSESVAEFDAQFRLLEQSVINYLDVADTPEKCDEALTKTMVSIEELEGKFIEDDQFIAKIHEKREEIHASFETRKIQLVEQLNRRSISLASSAERLLTGIKNRALKLGDPVEVNGFFAADMMIGKVRDIVDQLRDLNDNIKADDIASQLKASKDEVLRTLRDKKDLFVAGENVIKFGKHHFSVNTQPLDLTILPKDEVLQLHLTGTNFFLPLVDEKLSNAQDLWLQHFPSENAGLYRGEYLMYQFLQEKGGLENVTLKTVAEELRTFASKRLNEGYEKGIHDKDALLILEAFKKVSGEIGLLKYGKLDRSFAQYYWEVGIEAEQKAIWEKQIKTIGLIIQVFPDTTEFSELVEEIAEDMLLMIPPKALTGITPHRSASYLVNQLKDKDAFARSNASKMISDELLSHLKTVKALSKYQKGIASLTDSHEEQLEMHLAWLTAFSKGMDIDTETLVEAAVHMTFNNTTGDVVQTLDEVTVSGLKGDHPLIDKGNYRIRFDAFFDKVERYVQADLPRLEAFHTRKMELIDEWRTKLKLEEFKPKVLSSFIRNQLIDKTYLPIIGDNLSKQIGTVGDDNRTDRMGLLLLISPPGYGKTTLMEYTADRLGLTFVKVNGPAIGHEVTSVDPDDAPNSGARQELEKLNLSFEMGDNIMIYLDDIQHCNPEFLQKFISLCDGQRKIEGTFNGRSRTYDFRGKKVAVVMAGNPYTESGDKFQVPDMLANRADIYNLGDILGGSEAYFEASYIENSLTSNPYLQRLANKSLKDVYAIMDNAGQSASLDLEAAHTPEELSEYQSVLDKLVRIRDVVLSVNKEYIKSAAMSDDYRTTPPFKLQGSYRNMNKMASKVVPIMNEDEVNALILDHYNSEVQTLTDAAEANLLLFKKMGGYLSKEDQERLDYVLKIFQEQKAKATANNMEHVIVEMKNLNSLLKGIKEGMS